MSHRVLNIVPSCNSFFSSNKVPLELKGSKGYTVGSYSHASVIRPLTTKAEATEVVSIISDVREKRLQRDDSLIRGLSV